MAIAKEDMHPAVQLLLARMETDPEEFVGSTRWEKVLAMARDLVQPHEKHELEEKLRVIRLNAVHVQIMKILTKSEEPEDDNGEYVTPSVAEQARLQAENFKLQNMMHASAQNNGLYGSGDGGGSGNYLGNASGYDQAMNLNIQQQKAYDAMQQQMQQMQQSMLHRSAKSLSVLQEPSLKEQLREFGADLARPFKR